MFLLHWAGEGQGLKTGLNFYPPSEWKNHIGVKVRFGRRMIGLRWSMLRKRFHVWKHTAPRQFITWG